MTHRNDHSQDRGTGGNRDHRRDLQSPRENASSNEHRNGQGDPSRDYSSHEGDDYPQHQQRSEADDGRGFGARQDNDGRDPVRYGDSGRQLGRSLSPGDYADNGREGNGGRDHGGHGDYGRQGTGGRDHNSYGDSGGNGRRGQYGLEPSDYRDYDRQGSPGPDQGVRRNGSGGQPGYGNPGSHGGQTAIGLGAPQSNGAAQSHRGRGPKGYTRSDERLKDDVNERLTDDAQVDASDISVEVANGVVTLTGQVDTRWVKHHVENVIEQCAGVQEIENRMTLRRHAAGRQSLGSDSSPDANTGSSRVGSPDADGETQGENSSRMK